jgi:hypothetical protein
MLDASSLGHEAVALQQLEELVELARARGLLYPIDSKSDFVAQMSRSSAPVVFRGQEYDPAWSSQLIPEFFFPVASEGDLVAKALELLMARGMLPLDAMAARAGVDPTESEGHS